MRICSTSSGSNNYNPGKTSSVSSPWLFITNIVSFFLQRLFSQSSEEKFRPWVISNQLVSKLLLSQTMLECRMSG